MRSTRAKVLHELAGRPLVRYPLAALSPLAPDRVALVVGRQADDVGVAASDAGLADLRFILQPEQRISRRGLKTMNQTKTLRRPCARARAKLEQ